jgi:hypothetical protein
MVGRMSGVWGVQGHSPGKLERSRSDEETCEASFRKFTACPLAGSRSVQGGLVWARGLPWDRGDVSGPGSGMPNSRWSVRAGQVYPQSDPWAGPELYFTRVHQKPQPRYHRGRARG